MNNQQSDITVTRQDLLDLFQLPEDYSLQKSYYKSNMVLKLFSLKKACVQIFEDGFSDVTIRILNQSQPVSQWTKWKNPDKDLVINLTHQKNDTYKLDSAVAFRYGYTSSGNAETATLIFNTAVECVKDIMERDQKKYQEDRFKNLKDDMIALGHEQRQKATYYQYPT